jgi:hypothetical protein
MKKKLKIPTPILTLWLAPAAELGSPLWLHQTFFPQSNLLCVQ